MCRPGFILPEQGSKASSFAMSLKTDKTDARLRLADLEKSERQKAESQNKTTSHAEN
jgi:hypothetical protein